MNSTLYTEEREIRLVELDLPPDILMAARIHPSQLPQSQHDRILEVIRQSEEELEPLQRILSKLNPQTQRHVFEMHEERAMRLQRRISARKSILSLARQLPVETLQQIFEEYVKLGREVEEERRDLVLQNPQARSGQLRRALNDARRSGLRMVNYCPSLSEDEDDVCETAAERPRRHGDASNGGRCRPDPAVLSLVCHWWRAVALGRPSVWTNISMHARHQPVPGHQPCVGKATVDRFLERLEFIQTLPWTLHIDVSKLPLGMQLTSTAAESVVPLPLIFSRCPDACARLTRLSVDTTQYAVGLRGVEFPNVSSISIWGKQTSLQVTAMELLRDQRDQDILRLGLKDRRSLEDLPTLPGLKQAVLRNVYDIEWPGPTMTIMPPQIPWSQLTHLSLSELSRGQWRGLIRQCTALQKGVFTLIPDPLERKYGPFPAMPHPMYGDLSPVVLTSLEELTFFKLSPFSDHSPIPESCISFPALKTLRLFVDTQGVLIDRPIPGSGIWDCTNAASVLPALANLTLVVEVAGAKRGFNAKEDLEAILDTLPNLETLFVRVTDSLGELFSYLKYDSTKGTFNLRRLKALCIQSELHPQPSMTMRRGPRTEQRQSGLHPRMFEGLGAFLQSRTTSVERRCIPVQSLGLEALDTFVFFVEIPRGGLHPSSAASHQCDGLLDAAMEKLSGASVERVFVGVKEKKDVVPRDTVKAWRHWDEGYDEFVSGEKAWYGFH